MSNSSKSRESRSFVERIKEVSPLKTASVVAAVAIAAVAGERIATHTSKPGIPEPPYKTAAQYNDALRAELDSAFKKVTIDKAEDTGYRFIDESGVSRDVVSVHIASVINKAVNDNEKTPTYTYSSEPVEIAVMPDGSKLPGNIAWSDTQGGVATMNVGMPAFQGNTPTTVDYLVGLGAYATNDTGKVINAICSAGEVRVTGSNNRITRVAFTPEPVHDGPNVQIIELKSGESSHVPI